MSRWQNARWLKGRVTLMADLYELKQVQVRLRLSEAEPLYSTEKITTPDKAAAVMAGALSEMDREYCCVVNLDGSNHPINFNIVSIGDVNHAAVPVQNVFKAAILSNASAIMLFHNHPSGSLDPSKDDVELTKRIIEAGKIMNIPVIDHVIIAGGTGELVSMREEKPEIFNVREETRYENRPKTNIREMLDRNRERAKKEQIRAVEPKKKEVSL